MPKIKKTLHFGLGGITLIIVLFTLFNISRAENEIDPDLFPLRGSELIEDVKQQSIKVGYINALNIDLKNFFHSFIQDNFPMEFEFIYFEDMAQLETAAIRNEVDIIMDKSMYRILGNRQNEGLNLLVEEAQRSQQFVFSEDGDNTILLLDNSTNSIQDYIKLIGLLFFSLLSAFSLFALFKMVKENKMLKRENERDTLTGLYNGNAAEKRCQQLISKYPNQLGIFFFFDLDDLKFCNDTYGHPIGDKLIVEFSKKLSQFQNEKTICSRIAGDEFGLFSVGFENQSEIKKMISQMKIELRCDLHIDHETTLPIKFSAGGSIYNSDTANFSNLKRYADLAMYQVKHEKRKVRRDERVQIDIKLFDIESFRTQSSHTLEQILDDRQFYTVFQSINCMKSGKVYGYEALTRPTNSHISNIIELIELAESLGKLHELDLLMMESSLRNFKKTEQLFINMEYKPPKLVEEYIEKMINIAREVNIPISKVGIEVSERRQWSEESLMTLNGLKKKYNFLISADDYGAGFANDDLLLTLRPDIIKIDKSLVRHINKDKAKYDYLHALNEFIKKQKMLVIYEGIEQIDELNALNEIGQDYGQGWYFEKPRRHHN